MQRELVENDPERRERAEHIADTLAVAGFACCVAVGGGIGMALFGAPGMVAGGVICAPVSFAIGAAVNRMPFMKDVY